MRTDSRVDNQKKTRYTNNRCSRNSITDFFGKGRNR